MFPSFSSLSEKWIASSLCGSPHASAPAPYFRKVFHLDRPAQSASLTITALGLYHSELNGTAVTDHLLTPGWTDYRKRVSCQIYDVTPLLTVGTNVIGAILGDGWFSGHIAWKERQFYGKRPQFLAQLEIIFEDGSLLSVATDTSWQTSSGPILENDLVMGETYDARLELGRWSCPDFDAEGWTNTLEAIDPSILLGVNVGPPVRRIQELHPVSEHILKHPSHVRIFDFGQNFTGRTRMSVEAPPGTCVILRFGEALNPDGSLYTENLRTARAADKYTCRGGEVEKWEPLFTFHGFRYVEVNGLAPGTPLKIVAVVLHSDIRPTGSFQCSNPLLNQLQHNIVWGQKSNFLEVPMDCPQRDERLGWTGDALAFVRTACFNMDVRKFFHKWMQDVRDAQKPSGAVPYIAPDPDMAKNEDGGPAWSDATIICPWTIYLCYGDKEILRDHYASMRAYMDFLSAHRCKSLIRSHPDADPWGGFGDWLALDGSGSLKGGTPRDYIGTAFYANDARLMGCFAAVLGHNDDAKRYKVLHAGIVREFQERFIGEDHTPVVKTQTAFVLALHFELLPDFAISPTVGQLVQDIENRGYHLATGFVGTPYLLDVLEKNGRLDVAYQLLEQESFPSWLFPVKNGATTIWERWDGWTPENGFQDQKMNSFNHYAYGAVGSWMYRVVAGLDLDSHDPGYRHIVFRPQPGGSITWAEATLDIKGGTASIKWKLMKDGFEAKLQVPDGARGTFHTPKGYFPETKELPPGDHIVELKRI